MTWRRFSLRTLLVLVFFAGLAALAARRFVDRPYERVQRAMAAIWQEWPQAEIYYNNGQFFVKGAGGLSPETARKLREAELIREGQIHCGELRELEFSEESIDELRRGFEFVQWYLSRRGVAFGRLSPSSPEHKEIDFAALLQHPVERD